LETISLRLRASRRNSREIAGEIVGCQEKNGLHKFTDKITKLPGQSNRSKSNFPTKKRKKHSSENKVSTKKHRRKQSNPKTLRREPIKGK